jgi:hypothetical protein
VSGAVAGATQQRSLRLVLVVRQVALPLAFAACVPLAAAQEAVPEAPKGEVATSDDGWRIARDGPFQALRDGDTDVVLVQGFRYERGDERIRATWGVTWLSDEARYFGGSGFASEQAPQDANLLAQLPGTLREMLNSPNVLRIREIYLEGPVEYYVGDRRVFLADAIYLDRVDGHGWIAGARYSVKERIGGSTYVFKVDARWLRISADGSLRSNDASITTSEFAVPSYTIETGDLRMTPTGNSEFPWRVSMRDNKIRFGRAFALPLPPLSYLADEEGEPTFGGLKVGDEARFGTVLGIGYSRDVREEIGDALNRALGGDPDDFRSRFKVDLTYLGSRGLLTDFGSRLSSPGHYRWDTDLAVVPDDDADRGLVRVPEDERDTWRLWLRSRGRFDIARGEYVDLAITRQSDPAVQSEFFEDEYLEYEERESYLHWRRAEENRFTSVTVSGPLDPFRSATIRAPEVRHVIERSEVARVFGQPVLWRADNRVGFLSRVEGDPLFEPGFVDGFGEVNTMRVVTDHRVEMPIETGLPGVRAIPRIDTGLAGWSQDGLESGDAGRSTATAALRLSSSLWRGTVERGIVQVSPWIEGRSVFAENASEIGPAIYDPDVELRESGEFLELGLRGRWTLPDGPFELDGEVRATYAGDQSGPLGDRWLPVAVLGSIASEFGPVPWRLEHDGRYDTDTGATRYTRTAVELFPRDDLDLELAFSMGRDPADEKLFEAVTIGALYRFTPKWDIVGRQSWSLDGTQTLANSIGIVRYGHDLLFEIELRRRTGEGTSIGISIKPLFSAKKRSERRLDAFR